MFPSFQLSATQNIFKRAQKGLFGGAIKQFGNNVPKSKHKTPRTWLPNIQSKRLYSETLNKTLHLKVTPRVLRTIDKYGGLDQYLLGVKDTTLGEEGMRLRLAIWDAKHKQS
ncbi:ribosomal L28 family-domain-containing protein [Cantharellus anzutake]|uniref:ribosomal L28 family-domain-containing protein n=1 Tax=Cantharellus anzutake TaxID=1750568 RepID=UPI0019073377|nr:ribosomal L28 family-domain-containing protein [Cantharellus anzutake]KAF8336262.1 ribosomal L28 family-domain-containing protein [Cantharellus anzutake]